MSEAKADGSKALTSARTQFSLRFAPPPDCSQKDAACDDPAQQGMVGAYMPNTGDSLEVRNAAVELCRGQDGLVRTLVLPTCFSGQRFEGPPLAQGSEWAKDAPGVIFLSRFPTPFAIRPLLSLLSCTLVLWFLAGHACRVGTS